MFTIGKINILIRVKQTFSDVHFDPRMKYAYFVFISTAIIFIEYLV